MFNELNTNGKATVKDGIDTSDMEFRPLKDFVGKRIKVDGFFFTNGNYGKQVVVVGNGYLINMPARAVEQFEKIYDSEKMLQAVLDGKLVIVDVAPLETRNGSTTAYTLEDR